MNVQKRAKAADVAFCNIKFSSSVSCPIRVIVSFLRSVVHELDTRIDRSLRPSPIQFIPNRHISILCTSFLDEIFNTVRILPDRIDPRGQAKHAVGVNLDDRVINENVEIERLEGAAHVP
jgi:hypothetical protein